MSIEKLLIVEEQMIQKIKNKILCYFLTLTSSIIHFNNKNPKNMLITFIAISTAKCYTHSSSLHTFLNGNFVLKFVLKITSHHQQSSILMRNIQYNGLGNPVTNSKCASGAITYTDHWISRVNLLIGMRANI